MPYAILRTTKLKTSGNIAGSERHNERSRDTPNADPLKVTDNNRFIGTENVSLEDIIRERIGDNDGRKVRQSRSAQHSPVLAIELLMTASPEYFRPSNSGQASYWQTDRLDIWVKQNQAWLEDTFGDKVVRAELHLDEITPHIHAYLVPIDDKGHLNARYYLGGRDKLREMQSSYATAMQPIGLERGIKGSRAQHERIKNYYESVDKLPDESLTREELLSQAADRQRQVQRRAEMEHTARSLAVQNEALLQENYRLKGRLNQLEKAQERSHELRLISLPEVALKLGMKVSDFDVNRWYSSAHSIELKGSQFRFAGEDDKGYGAVDLVMQVKECSFQDSLLWLERQLGTGAARAATIEEVNTVVAEVKETQFVPPVQSESAWPRVRDRLLKQTYLPSPLVDQLHEQGLMYADAQGHAVFIERDTAGEVAGAIQRDEVGQYERIENSDEGAAFYVVTPDNELMQKPDRVVITDSPTEALAKLTLERTAQPAQRTQYQSLGGSRALEHAKCVSQVSIALSRSEAGERATQEVYRVIPWATSDPPDESHQAQLKAELDQLQVSMKRSQGQQTPERERRQRKERDQGFGM